MGVRERKVENYLDEQIRKMGGITRKWVSPGRDGVMDRICFIDPEWFVEVKTTDGTRSKNQRREGDKLMKKGARVAIVFGNAGVDKLIHWLKVNKETKPSVQIIFK